MLVTADCSAAADVMGMSETSKKRQREKLFHRHPKGCDLCEKGVLTPIGWRQPRCLAALHGVML